MPLHFRYVNFFDLRFFFLFAVLVTVYCPLLHRQGVSHSFLDVFFLQSTLILVLTEEENPKIFVVDFLFYFSNFRVHCVSSAVHSFSSGGTASLEGNPNDK